MRRHTTHPCHVIETKTTWSPNNAYHVQKTLQLLYCELCKLYVLEYIGTEAWDLEYRKVCTAILRFHELVDEFNYNRHNLDGFFVLWR